MIAPRSTSVDARAKVKSPLALAAVVGIAHRRHTVWRRIIGAAIQSHPIGIRPVHDLLRRTLGQQEQGTKDCIYKSNAEVHDQASFVLSIDTGGLLVAALTWRD
jgi:hypothetical protein